MFAIKQFISAAIASTTFATAPAVLAQGTDSAASAPEPANAPTISICVPAETPTGYDLPKRGAVSEDSLTSVQPAVICIEPTNLPHMTSGAQNRLQAVYKTLSADYANPQSVMPTAKRLSAVGNLPDIELNQAGHSTSGPNNTYESTTYLFTVTTGPDKYISGQMRFFRGMSQETTTPTTPAAPATRIQRLPTPSVSPAGSRPVLI